jgi:Transposase family tnp2
MKIKYIMLSLLISGSKQPGNDIDVYLAPLLEDLNKLWKDGVRIFDVYLKEYFILVLLFFARLMIFPHIVTYRVIDQKEQKRVQLWRRDSYDTIEKL